MSDPLWSNRKALLPLNGNASDLVGNTWTPVGSPTYTATSPVYAGTQSYVSATGKHLASPASFLSGIGTGTFLIEGWFNTSGTGDQVICGSSHTSGTSPNYIEIYVDSSGHLQFYSDAIGGGIGGGSVDLRDGAWHFFQVYRPTSNQVSVRVGNVGDANTTEVGGLPGVTQNLNSTNELWIGEDGSAGASFIGKISNFRISLGLVGTPDQSVPTAPFPFNSSTAVGDQTETSAGTDASSRTVAIVAATTESSAGTDASNRTLTFPRAVTETTAGTDSAARTVALSTGVGETSAGTDAQTQSGGSGGSSDQTETSAGTDSQNRTIAVSAAVTETGTGTDAQDQTGLSTWAVAESSTGTDSANRTVTTGTRSVAESALGGTTQTGTTPQPVGSGSNGLRRWVIQQYESYFAKRDKDKALKEVAKEIETLSGGVVSAQSVIKKERPPQPIVSLTPDAESVRLIRARQVAMRELDQAQKDFEARQAMLANGIPTSADIDGFLQRLESEQADEDLLLLASVL